MLHLIYYLSISFILPAQKFEEILAEVKSLPVHERQAHFDEYIKRQTKFPIIEGAQVVFLTKSDNGQPYLQADFNGFLNPRYTENKSIGLMKPIEGTSWYYYRKELVPDAVINYLYEDESGVSVDSLNSNTRTNFGTEVSFLSLGETQEVIPSTPEEQRGKLATIEIESEFQNHTRTVHIYTPFNYESTEELPSVYFHDGSFFIGDMQVPEMLDYLISNQLIQPVVAVFDNPVIRGKEYRGDSAYIGYIEQELVPYITKNYKVSKAKDDRAVIGFSRGGMSAFYLAYFTTTFSKLGALSPAIHPTPVDDFMSQLNQSTSSPQQAFITGAIYDHLWYKDAVSLYEKLKQNEVEVQYIENSQGHNIPSWQTQLDDMLIAFFKIE
ncbi:alpha/beta hydrolase [Ekhidna lutea]|nr:alpha/beta hydrolase-fold protein [Ekhidna lutea]